MHRYDFETRPRRRLVFIFLELASLLSAADNAARSVAIIESVGQDKHPDKGHLRILSGGGLASLPFGSSSCC